MPNEPRKALERLCAERGDDFAGLSRFLGRNPAYIQQFIRRGTPKRLGEDERRKLARYFGVAESTFGGPAEAELPPPGLVPVKRVLVRASAGPGAVPGLEREHPYFAFDERWLKALTGSKQGDLSIIRVEGDSMSHEELIAKVRSRVAMARRLADATHDPKTAAELRQMADDGEKDLAELESEIRTIEIKPKPE